MFLQPILQNEFVKIEPLKPEDFETLYAVASDPLLWEQHPNKDRYKKDVFQTFFEGAIKSGGAFLVYDAKTNQPIGSSRFYEYDADKRSISIGYTFIARDHWGHTFNKALKTLMINYALQFVGSIIFHIGAVNIRSQKSIEKLGAKKVDELVLEYYGETPKLNFIYEIKKDDWG